MYEGKTSKIKFYPKDEAFEKTKFKNHFNI